MVSPQSKAHQSQLALDISRDELLARLRDPSLAIINVLSHEAFAAEHILGSLNLPVAEIVEKARSLLQNTSQEIVVYCWTFT